MKSTSRTLSCAALALQLLLVAPRVAGHGNHASDNANDEQDDGMSYAEHHMLREHHLDAFDLESFFKIHDLNQDGILDQKELEAIYGLHHETSRENSDSDAHHAYKAEEIMKEVLSKLDQNGDGIVTKTEFVAAGKDGLPEFSHHAGLGHHYDSEGEYFLHHEEIYHSTPETQTEESYNHPEDIAHFQNHEAIEREEEDKARKAQGLPPTDPNIPLDDQTAQPDHDAKEAALNAKYAAQQDQQRVFIQAGNGNGQISEEELARQRRALANKEQQEKLQSQKDKAKERGPWQDGSFKKPKDKVDRLRDKIPYKYRVRSSFFGDFRSGKERDGFRGFLDIWQNSIRLLDQFSDQICNL